MDAPTGDPKPVFTTLADRHEGARFNSPNDLVFHSNGDLYFTDPPYGMVKQFSDPAREIPYQGVFRRSAGPRGHAADEGDDAAQWSGLLPG